MGHGCAQIAALLAPDEERFLQGWGVYNLEDAGPALLIALYRAGKQGVVPEVCRGSAHSQGERVSTALRASQSAQS